MAEDYKPCDHLAGWCAIHGDLTVHDKAETADGTTLWDRQVSFPTTDDPEVAAREGVGLWQIHTPTTAEVMVSYEESTRQQVEYARRRYAEPWSTIIIGAGAGEPIMVGNTWTDHLDEMVPLGWAGFGQVHWWGDPGTPIYNELCAEWRNAGRPTPPIMRG